MRDVVVVGGGLSGLVAAHELEKAGLRYTLIEVKKRLGGSIRTTAQDGFLMDGGPMALADEPPLRELLDELALAAAPFPLDEGVLALRGGTQQLVDALDARLLRAGRLMRMAVGSVGEFEGRCLLCLENGMALDAGALLLAVPARFAERMFYGYIPEISEALHDYHYDRILRLSLGYHAADMPALPKLPPDMAYVYCLRTEGPPRAPQGQVLLQLGLRLDPAAQDEHDLLQRIPQALGWPPPLSGRVDYWPEADPLSCHDDQHAARMAQVQAHLPQKMLLLGSDYGSEAPALAGVARLGERIHTARAAARQLIDRLA